MKSKGKSNTKKPHYLITVTYCGLAVKPIVQTLAISESLTNFLVRNADSPRDEYDFILNFSVPISKMDYKRLKLKYNPTNGSYFKLKKKDYR